MCEIRSARYTALSCPESSRWTWLAAVCAVLVLCDASVRAATVTSCSQDAACSAQFKQASQLYQEGQYARAVLAFQAAYDRRHEPRILVNIGRTLQKLGHPKEAIEFYERSQAAAPGDTALQTSVSKFITEARAQLEAQLHPPPAPPTAPTASGDAGGDGDKEPPPEGEVAEGATAPAAPKEPLEMPPMMLQQPYMRPVVKYVLTPSRPIYKRWWFWTLIGVAAAGGAAAIAVAVTRSSDSSQALPPDVRSYYPAF